MVHALKILTKYFEDIVNCSKQFEVRKADRPYAVGDFLALNEFNPKEAENNGYTGRSVLVKIIYIFDDAEYCKDGYIIIGFIRQSYLS